MFNLRHVYHFREDEYLSGASEILHCYCYFLLLLLRLRLPFVLFSTSLPPAGVSSVLYLLPLLEDKKYTHTDEHFKF